MDLKRKTRLVALSVPRRLLSLQCTNSYDEKTHSSPENKATAGRSCLTAESIARFQREKNKREELENPDLSLKKQNKTSRQWS